MAKQIIVFSDGDTWETNGFASIMVISDKAYDDLCNGEISVGDIQENDILRETPIEEINHE